MFIKNEDDIRDFIKKTFTINQCAVECTIFLFHNKEKSYTFREIWENIHDKINLSGSTPFNTCSTEIRKYTKNSPVTDKKSISLFKITNLLIEEENQKFELLEDIRKKIDYSLQFNIATLETDNLFLNSLKELISYSQKLVKFFELDEANKNALINEIYNTNTLEYFRNVQDFYIAEKPTKGPVIALRYLILLKFIEDKENNLENTTINLDFIENTVEKLCTTGFEGKAFEREMFTNWRNNYYVRVLLDLYDHKYRNINKQHLLNIMKFLILKLELESLDNLNKIILDKNGRFQPFGKTSPRNLKINDVSFTITDFMGTTNRFTYESWIAIYPSYFNDHREAYQIFFGINHYKENELMIGINAGTNLITSLCKEDRNRVVKRVIPDFENNNLIKEILSFYNLDLFSQLNDLEKKYRDFTDIKTWFCSPQPPSDDTYDDNMFVKMMEENVFAIGWPEFQQNMDDIADENLDFELKQNTELKPAAIKFHLQFKKEMQKGDIIIAKKGDRPQNPDKRIYGLGIVSSDYKYDEDFDPYGTHDVHYRKVNWLINFYNDDNKGILTEPFIDLKDILEEINIFKRHTIIEKDFNFYVEIKNAILQKLNTFVDNTSFSEKIVEKYEEKFSLLENLARCIYANRIEGDIIIEEEAKKQEESIKIKKIEEDQEAIAHIVSGRNIIFYGPPGTGKTRKAKKTTIDFCGENNYKTVTANAEWTTYDVVGGPTFSGPSKIIFKPGFLTNAAKKGLDFDGLEYSEKTNPFWIIIDEINRANLDLAFGKIFTLLDVDYRKGSILDESELDGMENKNKYLGVVLPKKFRIIATMNTYDKAILFSLGYAFRRRFAFIEVGSPFKTVEKKRYKESEDEWKKELEGQQPWIKVNVNKFDKDSMNFSIVKTDFFEKIKSFNEDFYNGKYDPYNPYKFVNKLASFLSKNKIVDIGYAQPTDLIKYVLIKITLFKEENFKIGIIKAIDEAVKAYFIPQILYYLPKARRLTSLGEGEEGKDAEQNLRHIMNLFKDLSLNKSFEIMGELIDSLKTGDIIKF